MPKESENEIQERIASTLEELLKWTRVTSIPFVKRILLDTLATNEDKLAYQLSDGEKTSRDVGKAIETDHTVIARRWKIWIRLGLAEPISVKGRGARARRLFSLDDFGIAIPVIGSATTISNGTQPEADNLE